MSYQFSKFVLRKPVTAFLIMLSIVFFGFISIISFQYELMPSISMPMYAVATIYPGAQPEDIDINITKKLEDELYNLQGVKHLQGSSRENVSILAVQYNYGQNMDQAYTDLKKAVDKVKTSFPDDVQEPSIYEMDINSMPSIKISVQNKTTTDIYNYVQENMVKELEKISEVSTVDTAGGRENYIKIELKPEMMARYNLSMSTLNQIIANADFSLPGGDVKVGQRELSMSTGVAYNTVESFKSIPIITGNKRTLYLEDIADVYQTKKDQTQIGRYDSEDCIVVSITKTQSSSTVALSKQVKKALERLKAADPNLEAIIVEDSADNVNNSIKNVFETMVIAIVLSMLIIFLFLGDLKASFIIGTSIPFSILTSFVLMYLNGYTLNIITLSALVLGVGMMVDNSIVVLEACFRASDEYEGKKEVSYYCLAALKASKTIGASVFGSTLTTVVVFAPLGFLSGMSGQFFKPLGFTIVFCMLASYVSAISVVPLTYVLIKPQEKESSPAGGLVRHLQDLYRRDLPKLLKHKWITAGISIIILVGSFSLIGTFERELVAATDNGMIKFDIVTKPGLTLDARNEIYTEFEEFVRKQPETEHYILSNSASSMSMTGGSSGQALVVYLKDDKTREKTDDIIRRWKKELANVTSCTVSLSSYSTSAVSMFVMPNSDKYEIFFQSNDYRYLKEANDRVVKLLEQRKDCGNTTTSLDNAAPRIKIEIDPILAASEGFTPMAVGGLLYNTLSGIKVMDKTIDNETMNIYLEYPGDEYDTIEKVSNMPLKSSNGVETTVKDIAKIYYEDNPSGIPKYDKKYKTTITTYFNEYATENSKEEIRKTIVEPMYSRYVERATSVVDDMLVEEFSALGIAVAIAAFLVFVVMASQFESVRYSLMVMGTVLFSASGAIFALWLANLKLSMVVLLGMLMLIGTAVNNGILYIDTVNQFLDDGKDLKWALVESGAIRLRPILMTTLTTIVSMIPMSMAYGQNGEVLQGLAVVDIGGLISSTLMAFFFLPVYYFIFSRRGGTPLERLRPIASDAIVQVDDEERERELRNAERRKNEKK
ncbi:MAG: efflux RND transporter permease subunit [Lachnospiraceae bacterium]|nr:efflux RND transporter permease subunit [Lachnospiraceae bacterium]